MPCDPRLISLEGMDSAPSTPSLLSPFDAADAVDTRCIQTTRGMVWVFKWAAASAVLFYSFAVLTEFAYSLAAEQLLVRAARAGVLEATLPRATMHSVEQSVWRRLDGDVGSHSDVKIALLQNGTWVSRKLQPHDGGRLALAVTMPARALMPAWLRTLTNWRSNATIQAQAERIMPGRKLSPQHKQGI